MYTRQYAAPERSSFLFGPRGTGKTTWLRQVLPDASWFDLLRTRTFLELTRQPDSFRQQVLVRPKGSWVVVDEVQRLPVLLNEVHALIAEHGRAGSFALSGSGARKLKRPDVNLLAGRAINRQFFPLTASEPGYDFDPEHVLRFGLLPQIQAEPGFALDSLDAYVTNYIREEIQQEALRRQIRRSFAVSTFAMERESTRNPRIRRAPSGMGWMGEVRPPVALLRSVVRKNAWNPECRHVFIRPTRSSEIIPSFTSNRRTSARKSSRNVATSKVAEGTNGSSNRSAPAIVRTCKWGCQFKNSPAVWMETMAAGRVGSRIFPEECGEGLPDAQTEFGEKPSSMPECRAQDLGEREDEVQVRDGVDHLSPGRIRPTGRRVWRSRKGRTPAPCRRRRQQEGIPQVATAQTVREVRRDCGTELKQGRRVLRDRGEVLPGGRRGGQHQDPGDPAAGGPPGRGVSPPESPHPHASRDLKWSHSTHSITR